MGRYFVEKRIKPTGGDFFVIGTCVILAVVIAILLLMGTATGKSRRLVISQNGEVIREIELNSSSGEEFIEIDGHYHNVIVVSGSEAGFVDSDCPNQDCVHSGMISKAGQVAACLPNRVILEIKGGENGYDAVTG